MEICIQGARVLSPDGKIEPTDIGITQGQIRLGGGARKSLRADGLLLLPGIVDLHGDAFERQWMPRPGVHFPLALALAETDRQIVANGITTAFHGVTWSWEPGLRGRDSAVAFFEAMEGARRSFAADTKLHLRHETYNIDAADELARWIEAGQIDLLAFNNHLPMMQRHRSNQTKLAQYGERAGLTVEDFVALIDHVAAVEPVVTETTERLAAIASEAAVPLASHDDDTPETRRFYRELGCRLCEFPLNRETMEAGRRAGDVVIMGAPNVVRGISHTGGLRAADMIGEALVDVLTSDYYYPSLLHAAFRLARDNIASLADAWRLVSSNPAKAAGFTDRGEIADGKRADLVLVDDSNPHMPHVVATFVAGKLVHSVNELAAA